MQGKGDVPKEELSEEEGAGWGEAWQASRQRPQGEECKLRKKVSAIQFRSPNSLYKFQMATYRLPRFADLPVEEE